MSIQPAPDQTAVPAASPPRPFGAHVHLSWWRPLVIVPVLLVLMIALQIVGFLVVGAIEVLVGRVDAEATPDASLSPWMFLAVNLSIMLMGPISIALMRWVGGVPVREQFTSPRPPALRRLGLYLALFLVLVLVANGALIALDPSTIPSITMSGGVITLIVVVLLTTPLQAAAEEIMFRGAIMPAIASWIRPARIAVGVGLLGSSIIFGLMHGSTDPWLLSYYVLFGVCMALMAVISGGLEAPIAFHVVNNTLLMLSAALATDDGHVVIDRSVGMGGPFMLIYMGLDIAAVALVWLLERRRQGARVAQPTS